MSKDFSEPLKNNAAKYDRLHVAIKPVNTPLFRRAKRGLLLVRDVPVSNEDVVVAGCELVIKDCEVVMRRKLEEAGKA